MMDFKNNIDAFLLNELDEEQKVLFVREMERNADFAADVDFQKKIMDASFANQELRNRIARIAEEEKNKNSLKYILGCILLLCVVAMCFLWFNRSGGNEPEVFAMDEILEVEYDHKSFVIKGGEINGLEKKLKEKIAYSFNEKEYSTTLNLLDSLGGIIALDSELKMLKGNCYYEISSFDEALSVFNDLIETGTRGERIYARYYSILVCLKENKNLNSCKLSVNEVVSEVGESGFDFEFMEELGFLERELD